MEVFLWEIMIIAATHADLANRAVSLVTLANRVIRAVMRTTTVSGCCFFW